jgi:polyhydroxyalkanoate synthesis repressor PhaR
MVIIKRYPNRKLYDTQSKQYITLDGIKELIRQGDEVQVIDHTSGEDLTALTLTQIILEEEKKQSGLLSHAALTGLIRAGGDRLAALQRSIFSTSFWSQIDEEIKRRVQGLIRQGEMTLAEGEALVEKLVDQGRSLRDERQSRGEGELPGGRKLEELLRKHQLPSQEDLERLNAQLEELASKLEDVS